MDEYDYGLKKEIRTVGELEEFMNNLPRNKVVLFLVDPRMYMKRNLSIIKILVNENKLSGIYITINRPFDTLIQTMKDNFIDIEKIFFIDCVTKMVPTRDKISLSPKNKLERAENCIFIPSPSRLTEIGLVLSEVISGTENPKNKFLYLDSLSTLLIYNDIETIIKFVHFLTTKIRLFGIVGIIMCVEKVIEEKLFNTLTEICDIIVNVVE